MTQDPITAEVFARALREGRTLSRSLIKVEAHYSTWWITIKPGQRAAIHAASGQFARYAGTPAAAGQDLALRTRMLSEFGGQW